jgi:serine/threonine-protein kinase OSR1/STK39
VIEFSPSPTAQELLETPFLKASKKKPYLVGAILSVYSLVALATGLTFMMWTEDLPPLSERQERRVAHHPQALHTLDSWDFATTLSPAVAGGHEQKVTSYIANNSQAGDGVFEMEDDPRRQEERHKGRDPKGISWAQELEIALVQDELERPETDIPSSSDLSDSDVADPQAGRSPSTSITDDSSPPSSFPDSTPIPNPRIPLAQPIDIPPMGTLPHECDLSATNSSIRVFPSTSISSSPGRRPLSSSANQAGLWQKFKSNVRRPSTRDGPSTDDKSSTRRGMSSVFGDASKQVTATTP